MKKKILKALIAFMVMLMPLVALALNTITYTAYYNGDAITGTDTLGGVTYTTVHYDGLYNGGAPGTPSLPVDYIRFSVPYNATNFTVTSTQSNTFIIHLNNMVYPCQQPRLMNDTTPVVITLPDSSAYFSGSYFPSPRAWVVDEGFLEGENHIVTVAVMPITYKHASSGAFRDIIKKSESVQLTLRYDLSNQPAKYPIIRQDTTWRNEGYALTRSIVANPGNVVANAPVEMTMDSLIFINPTPGDGLNGDIHPPTPIDTTGMGAGTNPSIINGGDLVPNEDYYPYLIVTTPDLEHAVRRIAALKKQKGYNVKVVTMNEVVNDSIAKQGDRIKQADGTYTIAYDDDAGKLRQFLKYYFKYHGTKFVLLAGNDLPYRIKNGIPTDWYYSDLNADYSQDSQYYWTNFSADFYADLYIGRLLAKTSEQINNYTDKALRYEINPGHGDYSYLRSTIVTQGRRLELLFNYFQKFVTNNLTTIFPNLSYLKELVGQNYPTGKNVIDSININNYGFICSLNHGSPQGMNVYGHGCDNSVTKHYVWAIDTIRNTSDSEVGNGLNNLHNKYYPMVYYSLSCETMPFGYNQGTSFGESFTMGKDYGGPIYIGNTKAGYVDIDYKLMKNFFSNLQKAEYKIGLAYSFSKIGENGVFMLEHYDGGITQNLLGDPSIEMWTDIPQQYSNVTVTRSDSTITISGINENSTIVAICDNANFITKKVVSTPTVTINLNSPSISIMLYKHNQIPYIVPMVLQNVTLNKSQYVIASDVVAGNSLGSGYNSRNVIVKSGVEYEIEASGTVTLQGGFEVEKGATFAIYPSSF